MITGSLISSYINIKDDEIDVPYDENSTLNTIHVHKELHDCYPRL